MRSTMENVVDRLFASLRPSVSLMNRLYASRPSGAPHGAHPALAGLPPAMFLPVSGKRLCILSGDPEGCPRIRRWAQEMGVEFHNASTLEAAVPDDWLIVDVDTLGGITAIVDDLLRFRLCWPGVEVILVSAEFDTDDTSAERLALSDISLRLPVTMSRLEAALPEMVINNLAWQDRLSELHLAAS